jgi:hypothetical protein
MKKGLLLICFLLSVLSCQSIDKPKPFLFKGQKIKGLSFVAPNKPIDSSQINPVVNIAANFISIMPYGFIGENSAELRYVSAKDTAKQQPIWWGETPAGVHKCIQLAHEKNLKVMLKPHIWAKNGVFTGKLSFTTEKEWLIFENSYRKYILEFAEIAENEHVAVFCMATEMETSVRERPEFWGKIIKEIRNIYKGNLTYAENWDAYQKVPFWQSLDYIGVDGYFPLSDQKTPSIVDLEKGWKIHKKGLQKTAGIYQKPILFTEFGYRSCDFTAKKPWESNYTLPNNEPAQANGYEAFFKTIWPEPWFAGVFIWKWFPFDNKNPKYIDTFTPQNKMGAITLKQGFLDEKMPK